MTLKQISASLVALACVSGASAQSAVTLSGIADAVITMGCGSISNQTVLECERSPTAAARALRRAGGTVVLVRVENSADGGEALRPSTEVTPPPGGPRPANLAELVPELQQEARDIVITKRQWGALFGTELDLQLRRRGVESTARAAFEHGYRQVFAEVAMATMAPEAHAMNTKAVFPRMGRVRSTDEIIAALSAS